MTVKDELKLQIIDSVILALREDIGAGDITSNTVIPQGMIIKARITAKEGGVICGLPIAQLVFSSLDKSIKFFSHVKDGQKVKAGQVIAELKGPARAILTGERTALNYLQRLSGIATTTYMYVKAAGKKVKILDTRKTAPALRVLEKYAVSSGGGVNHRIGLFDAVLIKDNHISAVGSISKAIRAAKHRYSKIEVEVKDPAQAIEAVKAGATRILLDNMSVARMKIAVRMIRAVDRNIEIEASGGVTLKNIKSIASTGVDYISVGALTHSPRALDINLKV